LDSEGQFASLRRMFWRSVKSSRLLTWILKVKSSNDFYRKRANMRQHAKFGTKRSNNCWDMAIFWFFKMAVVRYIRFLKVKRFNNS